MKKLANKQTLGEAIRFAMVGVLATALHYALYWLLLRLLGIGKEQQTAVTVAYGVGYAVSFLVNFWLTSWFTFRSKPSWKKLGGMAGAHAVNFLLHLLLLNLFLWLGMNAKWAPLPVFALVIPVNFLLVRFVFKARN